LLPEKLLLLLLPKYFLLCCKPFSPQPLVF
jgi:hypothetical protein